MLYGDHFFGIPRSLLAYDCTRRFKTFVMLNRETIVTPKHLWLQKRVEIIVYLFFPFFVDWFFKNFVKLDERLDL